MKQYIDDKSFSPAGLKVFVVDDDPFCLTVLEKMLQECNYVVTTCSRATTALQILRERREAFDLVISDVHMPDMDGFKLLELIGLEMGLPVIMMSANGDTDVVMKGVMYGACDYLVKPVRIEELRNIWQHVVRKQGNKPNNGLLTLKQEPSCEEWEDFVKASKDTRKKKRLIENEEYTFGDNINSNKRARVVWSFELHQQFVKAINRIGIDKAVPKRILEVMNIQGLTRENVASHLQKYRLYLKRLSGVKSEPFPIASFQAFNDGGTFGGTMQVHHPPATGPRSLIRSRSGPVLSSGQSYDLTTLASLKQLQALQQAAHEKGQLEAGLVMQPRMGGEGNNNGGGRTGFSNEEEELFFGMDEEFSFS